MLKTVLWALMGALGVVTVARFARGLGATTALSDAAPWGLWIAFDVMTGVALASGGFVVAATVYIFGRERYRAFARPAILTALLGYAAVALGLTYDLGLPWRIWHPAVYPQHRSVLFEVAMCVMLYLAVLLLEFSPVVLEHAWFQRPLFRWLRRLLKRLTVGLVIVGVVLSSLHQSSLGSLFLITPLRLHPLWYSPIIWILFLVSAVALGLMMVTAESFFSAWLFGHKLRLGLLSGLGRAASVVLFVYAGLRLSDLAVRGVLGAAFDGSWQAFLFLLELSVSALIPAVLLMFRRIRTNSVGLAACAAMTVLGIIGYRFNVCIVAFARPEGVSYFPSWMELVVSAGIVAGAVLTFIFFVEKLRVYPEEDGNAASQASADLNNENYAPVGMRMLLPDSLRVTRHYSLAATAAAAVTVAFLPADVLHGAQSERTRVSAARTLQAWMLDRAGQPGHDFSVAPPREPRPARAEPVVLLMIDGNRDARAVLFPHDRHAAALGEQESCRRCHHENMPLDQNTSCHECHRDMYLSTDLFDHASHIAELDGNHGCIRCHEDARAVKDRHSAAPCDQCHSDMVVEGSMVPLPDGGIRGIAAGYMDAMHGLCIRCHQQTTKDRRESHGGDLATCSTCHRDALANQRHETIEEAPN